VYRVAGRYPIPWFFCWSWRLSLQLSLQTSAQLSFPDERVDERATDYAQALPNACVAHGPLTVFPDPVFRGAWPAHAPPQP
jgi:hypothetical protein